MIRLNKMVNGACFLICLMLLRRWEDSAFCKEKLLHPISEPGPSYLIKVYRGPLFLLASSSNSRRSRLSLSLLLDFKLAAKKWQDFWYRELVMTFRIP